MTEHDLIYEPWQGEQRSDARTTVMNGVWRRNPVTVGMLGICSALAVTGRLENAVVMGAAVTFVLAASGIAISLLRSVTPPRIRLVSRIVLIGTFVILVEQLTGAFIPRINAQLGPYVGLIITNCIILGRAEAFASRNAPLISALDGLACGLGYALVLCLVALVRELLGTGRIVLEGFTTRRIVLVSLPAAYRPNDFLLLASGAFITLGFLIAAFRYVGARRTRNR